MLIVFFRKIFLTLITLIFLSLISFNILLRDPLNHLAELGWFEAYCYYVKSLLNGDFGISFSNGEPLTAQILQVFPATITLCLSALIVSLIIGLPLGFFCGYSAKKYGWAIIKYTRFIEFSRAGILAGISANVLRFSQSVGSVSNWRNPFALSETDGNRLFAIRYLVI